MSMWNPPRFENEPTKDYAKGSPERAELVAALQRAKQQQPAKIPLVVNGVTPERRRATDDHGSTTIQINSDTSTKQINPSRHGEAVAEYASATPQNVNAAIDAALRAKSVWENMPFEDRASIFLRACELISTKHRAEVVATTMLGQGKNIWHPRFTRPAHGTSSSIGRWKASFIWKPSPSALHSAWLLHKILLEAGLPQDVIQFVPGDAETITDTVLARREFAGLSYIGSTAVFKGLQRKIGNAIGDGVFASYPRVVGETGGKNWTIVHASADIGSAVCNTVRSAFEYQGQKCSALSRLYVAKSVWPDFRRQLQEQTALLQVGDPENFENFINPVIHERSFDKLNEVIESAKSDPELELVAGGQASKEVGYYVHPTVYRTRNPKHDIMVRELFGPILAVYVYDDDKWQETLGLLDGTSTYALTGAIFARDPIASRQAQEVLKHAAGMLYLNTKCTGSVVAQQPFGGSRDSGTNDKTGTMAHLQRFTSVRTIKEEFGSLSQVLYPSNEV
ncbi:1-pyrroline-5-carboxylate dehydrogenase [Fonsecaea nubica]|uniref:L-glutamate gamma-semialdehyde dehydrogenase n=1 Tax=Fonsecaea nubica TaxID=856822 RepID=A0A178D5T2_9EURO|nr:1-pyrroline-5-carboxylate dehydrogenase [Fonsecaea nubica]OAL36475.1 1-pyrroline-5-carboxylate dehydrogenase [Fonsecaea nubica]